MQGVLINGMCQFADGIGAATAATVASAELDVLYRPTVPFGCVAGTQRTVT